MIKTGQIYLYKPRKYEWYYIIYGAKKSDDKLYYVGMAFRDKIPKLTDKVFLSYLNKVAMESEILELPMVKNFHLTKEQIEKMQFVTYSPKFYARLSSTIELKPYVYELENYSKYHIAKYRREIGSVLFAPTEGYIVIFNIYKNIISYMPISKEMADSSEQVLKKFVIDALINRTETIYDTSDYYFDMFYWCLYKTLDIKGDIVKLKMLKYI